MTFFSTFISRPIASSLVALSIVLVGILGFRLLPIASLPQMDVPVIVVRASLSGASPETMATSVTTPLERALGRISGVSEMSSSSSLGSSMIILVFDFDKDINGAAHDVQSAINAAQSLLPTGMISRPSYFKINPSDAHIVIMTLTSESHTPGELYDYASTRLVQKLSKIQGVGEVSVNGSSLPAVRIELNPQALFNQGVSLNSVRNAITSANARRPQGAVENEAFRWQIQTNEEPKTAEEYRPLIVHYKNGAAVRLGDVATVKDSVENTRAIGMSNNKPAVSISIRKTADANIIQTVERIYEKMPELQEMLPASVKLTIAQDRSPTIRASLKEVKQSLIIAVSLVILVVLLFLRSWRATLIPATVIPISIVGTFAVMYLFGFSLNNISLMALTIATGFVVDDAIVVLENISRHIERGMRPFDAALQGMREVSFTLLSMSLSLIAVFIPLLMMDGMIGRLFYEFSITLSVAIAISLFISLTLTPMMCAHLLKKKGPQKFSEEKGRTTFFHKLQRGYANSLHWVLDHPRLTLLTLLTTIGLTGYFYVTIPKTFFPEQDTGRLGGVIIADSSSSFQSMRVKLESVMKGVYADPAVANVIGYTGGSRGSSSASMSVVLKPLSERTESAQEVIVRLRAKFAKEPGASVFFRAVQDIHAGGRDSNAGYQYSLLSDNLDALREWEPKIRQAFSMLPELADVNSDQQDTSAEIALIYDRERMASLGINIADANALLSNAFNQQEISTIYQPLNQYHVVMEVDPRYTQDISALNQLFVINKKGDPVPLSYFAHWQPANAPSSVEHEDTSAVSTISFNLAENITLSEASAAIERTMTALGVPLNVRGSFGGTAKLFQKSQNDQLYLLLAAIGTIYIVLGILYESYIHPLTILSTLPPAGLSALLALELSNTPFSLIALLGIMLLIGIVKKNAIMMVDVALEAQRREKLSSREAMFQAALLRFRPILMTTFASLFSALPLILTWGDGSELRRPLGITIVGGLVISQLLTLYTTPVVWLYMDKLRRKKHPSPDWA